MVLETQMICHACRINFEAILEAFSCQIARCPKKAGIVQVEQVPRRDLNIGSSPVSSSIPSRPKETDASRRRRLELQKRYEAKALSKEKRRIAARKRYHSNPKYKLKARIYLQKHRKQNPFRNKD